MFLMYKHQIREFVSSSGCGFLWNSFIHSTKPRDSADLLEWSTGFLAKFQNTSTACAAGPRTAVVSRCVLSSGGPGFSGLKTAGLISGVLAAVPTFGSCLCCWL
ncbi:hypothetical protein ACOSQ2_002514 [Xanthoceras sorbifolium]